jgi:hypothetical protein
MCLKIIKLDSGMFEASRYQCTMTYIMPAMEQ